MQEQNDRLLQQLSSKDEANFKLMSDRINANQKQVLLSAQIDELEKQVRNIGFKFAFPYNTLVFPDSNSRTSNGDAYNT